MIAGMTGTVVNHVVNFITVVTFISVVSILTDFMCHDAIAVFCHSI